MKLQELPVELLPREKLLANGAEALTDSELLAIVLRTGVTGKNVLALSREMLDDGGICALMEKSREEFTTIKGLGDAKYVQLHACMELTKRVLQQKLQQREVTIRNSADAKEFLALQLHNLKNEVFACMFLDSQHRLLEFQKMFSGTINASHVHIREIVRQALALNAAAIIAAHNHPSGVTTPSKSDIDITQKIKNALELFDIRLLDHCIVGDGDEVYSFADNGQI